MTPLNSIYRGAPGSSRCFSCNLGCNDEVLPAILITKPKIGFTWSKIADQRFRRGYWHGRTAFLYFGRPTMEELRQDIWCGALSTEQRSLGAERQANQAEKGPDARAVRRGLGLQSVQAPDPTPRAERTAASDRAGSDCRAKAMCWEVLQALFGGSRVGSHCYRSSRTP